MYSKIISKFNNTISRQRFSFYFPNSKKILKFINLLTKERLIQSYQLNKNKEIKVNLININNNSLIKKIKYFNKNQKIKPEKKLFGFNFIFVVLTNKGLMTNIQAKKKNLGGILICKIIC